MTKLVERGHPLDFIRALDLTSFQSLADSSERVWRQSKRFEARQQMISAQGTAKALKDLDNSLADPEERVADDQKRFNSRFGAPA